MTDRRVAVGLFLLLVGVYALFSGGHTYSSDEEGLLATTASIVDRGSPVIAVDDGNRTVLPVRAGRNGDTVGVGGLGQSLVAIPFYLVGRAFAAAIPTDFGDFMAVRTVVGFTNSVVTAVGAVLVYLLARRLGARTRRAVLVTLVYALATMVFPHAKTFFSEPLATTLLLATAWCAVESRARLRTWPRWVLAAGVFFGLALNARLTTGLMAIPLGAYLAATAGRRRWWLATAQRALLVTLGAVPGVLLLAATNWWRFGSALDAGYASVPLDFAIQEGLYGLFLSPGKSVFLYAPLTLVGLAALPFAPRERRLDVWFLASFGLINAVFFARFLHWHGDHSWGPRYLILSVPFFVLPVAAVVGRDRWRRAVIGAAAVGAVTSMLGVAIYFNQYFQIVADEMEWTMTPEGPSLWRPMHFDPYWSPLAGHARALPAAVRNTVDRIDGEDEDLAPFPGTTRQRYAWYFAPPQADSWVYWHLAGGGSRKMLVWVPVFLGAAVAGGVRLRRALAP